MVAGGSYPEKTKDFFDRLQAAADIVIGQEGTVRVISHYDGDGLCAAGIMCKALQMNSIPFWATITKSLDNETVKRFAGCGDADGGRGGGGSGADGAVECKSGEAAEAGGKPGLTIFLDLGSSYVDALERMAGQVMIVDHHQPVKESKRLAFVNPYFFGIDGAKEVCGSTLAYLLAVRMDARAKDLVGIGLAGLLADRQHLGGIKGLNKMIVDEALDDGRIKAQKGLSIYGDTVREAIHMSVEPFFRGLTGRTKDIDKLLAGLAIDPATRLEMLTPAQRTVLGSVLVLRLLKQGVLPGTAQDLIIDKYWLVKEDMWARDLAAMVNACGRLDHEDIGVSAAMGDHDALDQAKAFREEHRHAIRMDMFALEKKGPTVMEHIQFIESKDPARAGALAGLAMNFLFTQDKPTFAISRVDGTTRISSRGTYALIAQGVNLADACRKAAEVVGGEGGGHPIASGASMPTHEVERFLKEADRLVGEQVKRGPSLNG